jgi:hypothetical protein
LEIDIQQATEFDLAYARKHIRAENEGDLLVGKEMQHLVESRYAWATRVNGRLVAVGGAVPAGMITGRAVLWMVTTAAADSTPKALARFSPRVIDGLHLQFNDLYAYARPDFVRGRRWLTWLGFRHIGEVDIERQLLLYHRSRNG